MLFAQGQQFRSQLPRQIDSPSPVALWARETALSVVPLHQNVPIGVIVVFAELDVSPLQRNQLALAQTRAHCSQKEWLPFEADVLYTG